MTTIIKYQQDRTRRRNRKNKEKQRDTKLSKTIYNYKAKYRIPTKKWILRNPTRTGSEPPPNIQPQTKTKKAETKFRLNPLTH